MDLKKSLKGLFQTFVFRLGVHSREWFTVAFSITFCWIVVLLFVKSWQSSLATADIDFPIVLQRVERDRTLAPTRPDLPLAIQGLFRTRLPMYYSCHADRDVEDHNMKLGFGSAGVLNKVEFANWGESVPQDQISGKVAIAAYAEKVKAFLDDGAPVGIIFQCQVSPAAAVFWDTDLDYLLPEVGRCLGRSDWSVINLSYRFKGLTEMRKRYEWWLSMVPDARVAGAANDTDGIRAAFWTRNAAVAFLEAYEAGSLINEGPSRDVIHQNLMLLFGVNYLIATPPLFPYRPLNEEALQDLSAKDLETEQQIVDVLKWTSENSEIFEGLHAYSRMSKEEQTNIAMDAFRRTVESLARKLDLPESSAEVQTLARKTPVRRQLAARLLDFLLDTAWLVVHN